MIIGENCKPEIQRIRYKKGQLFASRDLRDDHIIAATLRWLHNRALHDAYGVNRGMTVTRIDEYGNPVNQDVDFVALEISEGLAYDCFGRELILYEPRRISLPSVPPNSKTIMTLLVYYKDTATFPKKNSVEGSCIPGELPPLLEQPEFLWKPESLVELIDGVAIARINFDELGNPSLSKEDSKAPISRPLAKQYIASGTTIPGNTAWEKWTVTKEIKERLVGIQARINTSTAGFTETPCYFAWLQQASLWNEVDQNNYLAHFENIYDPTPTEFTFRIFLLPIDVGHAKSIRLQENIINNFLEYFREHKLFVSWLGIQPIKEKL